MADVALVNNDIVVSNFGDLLVVDDDSDVIQMAVNSILTIYSANELHPNLGNTVYNDRFKMSERGLKDIAGRCKNAILNDPRVANVLEIVARNASTPQNYGLCEVSFVLLTTYDRELSSSVSIIIP